MDYSSTIQFLFNQLPVFQVLGAGAYKPGLQTAHLLDDAFGNPHRRFRTVHVAGTNGKGSTTHALASVMMAAGYKVGLYTSPHLFDFRERIRVNGEKIPEEFVTDFVARYQQMDLGCEPSFFELTTIMAFDYFAKAGVDYAIIEVGLGGRLDTTNIITPELCVITNVSLDHVALLGDTEEQIAAEKAGIMKPGVPVVISEAQGGVREVFAKHAQAVGSPIVFAEDTPMMPSDKYKCDLQGPWQEKNINGVLHALKLLDVSEEAIIEGLGNVASRTGLMGRWTVIRESGPRVIIDTGHNIGAWQYLAPRLYEIAKDERLAVVLGFANDKDAEGILRMLPKDAQYFWVQPSVKRARPASELLALGETFGLKGKVCASVAEGCKEALASDASTVFIGGSNFVVAEVEQHLG